MANRTVRDNTLAGLFVLGGIALAVWSSFMLGEQTGLGGMSRVTVQFPVGLGSHGLKPGALVMLGGQKIGNVDSISFSPKGGTPTHVDVAVELPRQLKLMSDAATFTQGTWAEFLCYSRVLTASESALVEAYLQARYAHY